ncbi:MAG: FHIPEP family type III secretion protein [Deltaproteobacteria bacterium]|nr:FHIPEP family type III secretion protein [Deltaproteobacteria bacterium]
MLRDSIAGVNGEKYLSLEPALSRDILEAVRREVARGSVARHSVVLTSPEIRRHVRKLLAGEHPGLAVLSHPELLPGVRLDPVRISIQSNKS